MRISVLQSITICAAVAFAASAPIAQAEKPSTNKPLTGKLVRGKQVLGAKLFNQKGEHIGEINDVLFDENAGGVTHGILSVGGWAGLGDKLTPVPWKFIKQSEKDTPGFVVDVEKSKLTGAENFTNSTWPNLNQEWYDKTYTYYGLTGKTGKKLVRASKVIGAELFNQQAEDIGEIHELLLHPNSGKVAYAIVDVDEYIDQKEKLTTVPWKLIRESKKDTPGFVVNVDKTKLKGAHSFSANSWPDYSDLGWNNTVYDYYGVDRYWADPIVY